MVVIFDQDKGLHAAVSEILPEAEHRVCMRHFWKTFKNNYPGLLFEQVVWDASMAFSFSEYVRQIKILAKASMLALMS